MTRTRCLMLLKAAPVLLGAASASYAVAAMPHDAAADPKLPGTTAAAPDAGAAIVVEPGAQPVLRPAVVVEPATPALQAAAAGDEVVTPEGATTVDAAQAECVAKVIVHEAGGEPHRGQVAVAQVIRTRMKMGRFGHDACSVIRQRGQFFDVDAYDPPRTSATWSNAVAIANETLAGLGDEVAPGALFFHAARSTMNRERVAQIGGHVFYR